MNVVVLRDLARAKARKDDLSTTWKKVFSQYNQHVKSEKCVSCREMFEGFLEHEQKHLRGAERGSKAAVVVVTPPAAKLG